ncbi:MAG: putative S-adenosylmethionine-dependent methyltransferase [Candidatus Methanofastidiosum methylothiophilum]|uniref:Putative S-adenosylmethionine-dependent methyltransferase n=1 Tax=Candidatus Methanofastidiosum methylothiophilum TaxID=1705564 RepID=A0A150JA81_9EURY|nr:MAG: putative S-adenosylmethionine-dependent methyltransferase [Candidatus Methanofastidiosum methylthiophilus]NMC77284.1 methyltransferase [Candidatus Methanofastidiosa archaeon]
MDILDLIIKHDDRVYFPDDDSYLLIEAIDPSDSINALEIGVGSGIISMHLAKTVNHVFGCDINPYALSLSKTNASLNSINNLFLFASNIFSSLKFGALFDIIVFNPPYLPVDSTPKDLIDLSYNGGSDGGLYIRQFLKDFNSFLSPNGKAYLLQSSLYPLENTINFLNQNNFRFKDKKFINLDFESLHVFEISRL